MPILMGNKERSTPGWSKHPVKLSTKINIFLFLINLVLDFFFNKIRLFFNFLTFSFFFDFFDFFRFFSIFWLFLIFSIFLTFFRIFGQILVDFSIFFRKIFITKKYLYWGIRGDIVHKIFQNSENFDFFVRGDPYEIFGFWAQISKSEKSLFSNPSHCIINFWPKKFSGTNF